jgi:ABC-type nitrate/sulfonate/bicarbonate transport system ATPase subunit
MENFHEVLPDRGCVCFFGVSGVGKTTLLDTIADLKNPASGSVYSADSNGKHCKLARLAYVFQEDRLLPWLSAVDNVALVLYEKNKMKAKEEALRYLEMTGLKDASGKFPDELSGGMKQRVNISRALAFDSKILLLDEPFKGLDMVMKHEIIAVLNDYKKTGLILLVTHDKEDIEALADRVVELLDDRIE